MSELPFSSDLIRFLAERRTDLLTHVFAFFTFLGEVGGFVMLIALVYVAWDKQLAYRLAIMALVAMSLNHVLKMSIMNPRPFVSEGTWAEKWAVTPERANELVTEYSTPSGHAMSGAAFYGYAYASVPQRAFQLACVALILLTGLSRPYLGVHYLEDVLLGWALGIALAAVAIRRGARIGERWNGLSRAWQIGCVVAASGLIWLATLALASSHQQAPPLAFLSYSGFLLGIVVARPLEAEHVRFDPRSASALHKALRWLACVLLVMGTLWLLDRLFEALSDDLSAVGMALRYVRYAAAGFAGLYLAPLAFTRLGWAERLPER